MNQKPVILLELGIAGLQIIYQILQQVLLKTKLRDHCKYNVKLRERKLKFEENFVFKMKSIRMQKNMHTHTLHIDTPRITHILMHRTQVENLVLQRVFIPNENDHKMNVFTELIETYGNNNSQFYLLKIFLSFFIIARILLFSVKDVTSSLAFN